MFYDLLLSLKVLKGVKGGALFLLSERRKSKQAASVTQWERLHAGIHWRMVGREA